ncbi:MAG: hypothetical protein D6689_19770 [Deltaproteobacteria bacterium]|nr:MAG: hypothetical protein D6689_19770 [Deltaproteobacteria bacterium]
MRTNATDDGGRVELPELATEHVAPDGQSIRARCFARATGGTTRYEVVVEGCGVRAIVDVADGTRLAERIEDAVCALWASARLRARRATAGGANRA